MQLQFWLCSANEIEWNKLVSHLTRTNWKQDKIKTRRRYKPERDLSSNNPEWGRPSTPVSVHMYIGIAMIFAKECIHSRPVRRRAAAISATPPTVRARRAAAAADDIFVDRRGGVTVPNSSLWLCVRAKLHICLLIVCWTDIGMKTLILSYFCSCVPMFSKAMLAVVATSEPSECVFWVAGSTYAAAPRSSCL